MQPAELTGRHVGNYVPASTSEGAWYTILGKETSKTIYRVKGHRPHLARYLKKAVQTFANSAGLSYLIFLQFRELTTSHVKKNHVADIDIDLYLGWDVLFNGAGKMKSYDMVEELSDIRPSELQGFQTRNRIVKSLARYVWGYGYVW
ncbi:uncharacterized protein DFL_006284 [Arthrobotrys flagrans]|uniref:Uncharacterized protein n=1 Tax=Arthrobotrys flagrans TaxID=97331 RepID=A0A436ZZU3_ARTFL|nr:hypothetical protein DFL_006284 [Arthrobotrys flagrans]